MKHPRAICVPKLRPQPSLLQVLRMEQGRLATYTFGAPSDPVFDVVTTPCEPSDKPY